jgi:hypothetical protein
MALQLIEPLTEMSIDNLPGIKCGKGVRLTNLPPSLIQFPGKFGSLNVSKTFRPSRPVRG